YWHDEVRKKHLWGNLMAGGAGVEWYFGYKFAHNDLNCEDWRSREHLWDLTRFALVFFKEHLPFTEMAHHDELTSAKDDYCFALPGQIYAIYLPAGGTTKLDLGSTTATFTVQWYNPRTAGPLQTGTVAGPLQTGTVAEITGPGPAAIGQPPSDSGKDWVALIKRK
ncbi:MAG: putative collagen-binding domain-containing protein, partial [Planctomycetota bacterium]